MVDGVFQPEELSLFRNIFDEAASDLHVFKAGGRPKASAQRELRNKGRRSGLRRRLL